MTELRSGASAAAAPNAACGGVSAHRARTPPSRWRGLLAVLAGTLASFLVVLVLLTVRVVSGVDPALRVAPTAALVTHRGQTVLRTTASGRIIGSEQVAGGSEPAGSQPATVVTRTSGVPGAGERDE